MAPDYRSNLQIRETLEALMREHGRSRAELSRLIGRNPSYIGRFLADGRPERLPRDDARLISRYFGVPEHELGA